MFRSVCPNILKRSEKVQMMDIAPCLWNSFPLPVDVAPTVFTSEHHVKFCFSEAFSDVMLSFFLALCAAATLYCCFNLNSILIYFVFVLK